MTPRFHALDSLRGFAMFLGIALHAGISFTFTPVPFWSVRDARGTPLADVFMFAVHDFRMQTFFLLAGFFGCLLYQRYGLAGMASHRVKRVAVPFLLGLIFIIPTILAAFLYAELDNVRTHGVPEKPTPARVYAAELIAAEPHKSNAELVLGRFTSGEALAFLQPGHLWFLYYLLIFYAAVLFTAPLLERLSGTRFLAKLDAAFRRLIEGRWRVLLPAAVTLPVLLLMTSPVPVVDTQFWWKPQWHLLLYYAGFFGFGWMLYRHRDLVDSFGRGWRLNLLLANLLVLPVALVGFGGSMEALKTGENVGAWWFFAFAGQALYTWLMIVGLWGAFLHVFARESARARYMADASYWCYLASITPIIVFQFAVKDWPLPAELKWLLVTVATFAVLLASYEWCVRYTFVGAILNGRKYRTRAERAPTDDPVGERRSEAIREENRV